MDLLPSDEDLDISGTVAALLARALPVAALHAAPDTTRLALSDEAWQACAESGVLGLGLAEASGGVGLGPVAEVMAFRELGRHLAPGPFLASVLAAHLAAAAGDAELAEAMAAGESRVGLVLPPVPDLTGGRLSGQVDILDALGAQHVLLLTPEFAALYPAAGLTGRTAVEAIDPALRIETARADGIEPTVVAPDPGLLASRGVLLLSALLTGVAEATRDASTAYAITREQFGRPIGVNQAIKHRCADMAVYAAAAESQLLYAAAAAEAELPDAAYHASAARVVAARAATFNSEANIQVHGGIGYAAEHDAHLFVKRARALAPLLGGKRTHLRVVLDTVPAS